MKYKIGLIQNSYPQNLKEAVKVTKNTINLAKSCENDTDLIVISEYSNCPGAATLEDARQIISSVPEYILELKKAAKANGVNIAVNVLYENEKRFFNRTLLIDRKGNEVFGYNKTHLTPTETEDFNVTYGTETGYYELEGVKLGFATCFDMYFSEYFEKLASYRPDIIIIPSYQRGEEAEILKKQLQARALDCEAYCVRCSYSMGDGAQKGGHSMVCSPKGEIIFDAKQEEGIFYIDIDPKLKRTREVCYLKPQMTSRQIIDRYRVPSVYRKSGQIIMRPQDAPYPRVVAHRGLSGILPENTIPSFAAAIAMGAHEIEFDIRSSKDKEMVVFHDGQVDKTTKGTGMVGDLSWQYLSGLDADCHKQLENFKLCLAEDVFKNFAGKVVMNIHLKEPGEDGWIIRKIRQLAYKYEVQESIYIAGEKDVLEASLKYAPDIERCCLEGQKDRSIIKWALKYDCRRVQFGRNSYDEKMIAEAKKHGMKCNLFYADDADEARHALKIGIDSILTNYTNIVLPVINQYKSEMKNEY
jgi:predicted amidohydrolase/glycerophosphoryl diester phosphodiesterase